MIRLSRVFLATALAVASVALVSWRTADAASHAQVLGITSVQLDRPIKAGESSTLKVNALILPGWHINSDHPGSDEFIPTRLRVSAPAGISAGTVKYPAAQDLTLAIAGNEKLSVFTGPIAFAMPLTASSSFVPGPGHQLTVTIDYQPCNDRLCLRPASVSSTVELATLADSGGGKIDGAVAASSAAASGGSDSDDLISRIFAKHGLILGFLAVLLGGLALNLTPCVYPLIGVTIAYFGNQGGGPRRVLMLAIVYVFGIALMFSSVGVAVALSGGIFGAALQNPYVLSGIAIVLAGLAMSSFGLFVIQPPQSMMQWAGAARPGYAGSLLMGLGMGVVAAPCIGPIVLGLLLMVERSRSALFGFALFFTLAIGLGLPYLGLAMAAGSIRRLPRSGEWLAWVEQLFGFVLIGLAIYFLDPVVPRHLMIRVLPYYAVAAALFLGFVTRAGRNWRPFLVIRSAVGIAALAMLAYLLIPHAAPASLQFEAFAPSRLDAAASERRPVLIDFSADWCIPCREMEHSTFTDPSVVREADRFLRLRANLTAQDKQNEDLISRFAIQGVPTTMLIDSHGHIQVRKVGYVGPGELLSDLRRID